MAFRLSTITKLQLLLLSLLLTTLIFNDVVGLQPPGANPNVLYNPKGNSFHLDGRKGEETQDDTIISSQEEWLQRRLEILDCFCDLVYGRVPDQVPYKTSFQVLEETNCRNDTTLPTIEATRYRIQVTIATKTNEFSFPFVLYIPSPEMTTTKRQSDDNILDSKAVRFPTFLLIVNRDETFLDPATHLDKNHDYWPVRDIIKAGFATAAYWAGDVDPDDCDDSFQNGIHPILDQDKARTGSSWGTISAWAWAASRILDVLEESRPEIGKVAVIGHSRGGKTALWAAAQDERFAMAVSNNSGCTGAALSKRKQDGAHGETVQQINDVFPNWFCRNYRKYNGKEDSLPIDQHMLLALISPRPLCVASATLDEWADPLGEYISTRDAAAAWSLFHGAESLLPESQPLPNTPVQSGSIQYHLRSGDHDLTKYDWEQYFKMGKQFLL